MVVGLPILWLVVVRGCAEEQALTRVRWPDMLRYNSSLCHSRCVQCVLLVMAYREGDVILSLSFGEIPMIILHC